MSVHVIDEANRCLQCPNPRCREKGCPIHTNIPEKNRKALSPCGFSSFSFWIRTSYYLRYEGS